MEIIGILVLFTAKQGITRKSYEGIPLRTADKVYLVFLCLGYLLCMAAIVLSFPEYAISTPRILVVSAGMAFAICVVDLLSDLIGLGMGAKEAGRGLTVIAYLMGIALPVTYLIARLQGLYWHDSISTGMIIVRDVFVASTGLVVLLTFVKDFLRKKQD